MGNPMKYIKDLEAAGFKRNQAEAQVQMVLDAIEGDLVTKADFAVFQERIDNRFVHMENRLIQSQNQIIIRLGFLTISVASISVAVLTWLIKI